MFSGVASIPEFGSMYLRQRETLNTREFVDTIISGIKNREDLIDVAEAMGIIERNILDSVLQEMFIDTQRGQGRFFSKMLGPMFKLNGNDYIVKMTRALSTAVAMNFLLKNAQKVASTDAASPEHTRAKRYLKQLGILDPETVLQWDARKRGLAKKDPKFAADDRLVEDAIRMFVRDSVLKPNAAERATYFHSPIGGLVANLKSFSYSHTKNVMGGMYREGQERYKEDGNLTGMMPFYLAVFGVFVALGALSDELRNRVKSLGAKGTWEASNRDLDKMATKWVDRAGFTALPFWDAIPIPPVKDVSTFDAAFALGPTASHMYDLFGDGDGIDKGEVLRSIPVVSQINALRSALM
jgi:hypothetical protein